MSCSCLQGLDVGEEVLRTDALGGVGIHVVHVGDALEGSLFRGEEPVDGAVLVHLFMVFPEVLHEVLLNIQFVFFPCGTNFLQPLCGKEVHHGSDSSCTRGAHRHTFHAGDAFGCIDFLRV